MIQPNAKCVVNGKKVNEIALWVNEFLKLNNEELDVVDVNNTPAKRWFLTGAITGAPAAAESGDRDNLGGTSGGAAGTGGGASGNRDKLTPAPAGGGGGPIGGGGQGGNVNPAVNVDGGGGGAAAGGGGAGAAGGGGRVRTPSGSATAIGGRRARPAAGDVAPEAIPIASQQPTTASRPATGSKKPLATGGGDNIPLTASGKIDLSKMTPEQKEKYGFTDNIPLTASGKINLSMLTPEQKEKLGFTDRDGVQPATAETNPIDAIYRKLNNNKTRIKRIQAEIDDVETLIRTMRIPYNQVPAAKKTIQRLNDAKAAIQKENASLMKELARMRQG